jgi:hypothetical protein
MSQQSIENDNHPRRSQTINMSLGGRIVFLADKIEEENITNFKAGQSGDNVTLPCSK